MLNVRAIMILLSFCFFYGAPVYAAPQYNTLQTAAVQGDEVAADLLVWQELLEDQNPSFDRLTSFITNHSDWPLINDLKERAEYLTHTQNIPADKIKAWFQSNEPKTDEGRLAYMRALDHTQAQVVAKQYWREGAFDNGQQAEVLKKFSFGQADHVARADNLLWRRNFPRAEKALTYVSLSQEKQTLNARLQLLKGDSDALYKSLPSALKNDSTVAYARLRFLREKRQNDGAKIFLTQNDHFKSGRESAWWAERHILARRALENKHYQDAYDLASAHGFVDGINFANGEWLSGWVALTYLDKPDVAFDHFDKMYRVVKTPISKSRAGYGAGLAAEKIGSNDIAAQWYQVAAQYIHTFYGQKALAKLGNKNQVLQVMLKESSRQDLNTIQSSTGFDAASNTYIHAAKLLDEAGLEKERDLFLLKTVWKSDIGGLVYLRDLCEDMQSKVTCLSVGKRLYQKGITDWDALFPRLNFKTTGVIDPALTHAVIRQESTFNPNVISRAQAKGLMQLLSGTAKQQASEFGIVHEDAWLFSKPQHNVRLGEGYMAGLLARYDGSLPLAIAAYNAGPGNVDKWLTQIGDPRSNMDELEWLEKIPFRETRNYVQRVLEARAVYQITPSITK